MDWTTILFIIVFALLMLGCCGWPLIKSFRNKAKDKTDDRDDKH